MRRQVIGILLGSLLMTAAVAATSPLKSAEPPPFRAAVEAHLAAISARNLTALLPTLTAGEALTMIAPNGFKFDTRQQYIDFHEQWFAAPDGGKLEAQIASVTESPALAHALIKYRYTSKDASGKQQSTLCWLALTFALEKGSWRLVFDQNTLITEPVSG
jgi:ketosteroid isomerase-like protein